MKVLVTGGGGFLGKHIVARLLARGDEVVSIARSDYPELRALGAQTVRGDLANMSAVEEAAEGVDAVIHTAARVGMWGPREDFVRVNITATQNLLAASKKFGVRDFVFTSSPSVTFGGGDAVNAGQDEPYPETFLAHYPETKAQAERHVLQAHGPQLRTTSLRPHLIWGPGDPHLIPRLVERARAGKLRIVGEGTNRVDITYVDNAAQAHLDALDALARPPEAPNPGGRAYFISNDEPVELWPWINALLERLGIDPVTKKLSQKAAYRAGAAMEATWKTLRLGGEPPMTRFVASQLATSHWYDMAPARRDLGYAPHVTMAQGLERLIESMESV